MFIIKDIFMLKSRLTLCLYLLSLLLPSLLDAADPPEPPDFTAGGEREAGKADLNLGPIGARGYVWGWHEGAYTSRQILVTQVAEGSPAAGILQVDDVILGVNGQKFEIDARRALGEAIAPAEVTGRLSIILWREGTETNVELSLPILGAYSQTWPYGCEKSEKILQQGCEWIASTELKGVSGDVNALALLASGDEQYLPLIQEYVHSIGPPDLRLNFETVGGYPTWNWGYRSILLAEYYIATGDDYVLPALRQHVHEIARGQSAVGTWGHRMADPETNEGALHGRLGGYGAVNAAGLPCFVGMTLAQEKCGITDDPELTAAIDRCSRFFRFYANKGSIPYGFHDPRMVDHDDNGKNSMGAVVFDLLDLNEEVRHFSRWALASYDSRELGHTGNFFSYLWGAPGVARIGPRSLNAFLEEQRWYYDLARDHLGRMHYQGQPGQGRQNYSGWDCTGVYLIAYAIPKQATYFSGRGVKHENILNADGVAETLLAGSGYTTWDRGAAHYSGLSVDELFESLKIWSPLTRQRAAKALVEKEGDHIPRLVAMLESDDQDARFGACQALQAIGPDDESRPIAALISLLDEDDLWLRVNAAQALAAIGGEAARPAADRMLVLLANEDPDDTLMLESRFIGECLFRKGGRGVKPGLLSTSVEGVDREVLFDTARRILTNPCGGARMCVTSLYAIMMPEDLKPIMPEIIDSIERPGCSVMFSNGVREEGLKFLAEHHIEEGLEQLVWIMDPENQTAGYWFAPRVIKYYEQYGGAASPYLPRLNEFAELYKVNRMLESNERFQQQMADTLEMIENDKDPPELTSWEQL
jgi:hypothetical protein